jgi:cellulose synthase/poly-beta-1,6-N-acetylglucosamine synthase-like glycosyltransferase
MALEEGAAHVASLTAMETLAAVIFLLGSLTVLYPYLIYPALIGAMARFGAAEGPGIEPAPARVAILVSAYNEEAAIAGKIENFLRLDYPAHLLELRIGDDGSSDETAAIVRRFANERIKLLSLGGRNGKTAVLNHLAAMGPADLLVFTDVNCRFRPDAVRQLARAFADPRVGLVSGRTVIIGGDADAEGFYARFEQWLKRKESRMGWLCGADGAIYMLRASLYRPLDPSLINDFTHPWQALLSGYTAHMEPGAICEEPPGEWPAREIQRQRRIVSQSMLVARTFAGQLLRRGMWGPLWVLFSHKICRWAVAGGALMMLGAAIYFVARQQPWYLLGLPLAAAAAWAAVLAGGPVRRLAALPLSFLAVHCAYLLGIADYLRGNRYVTWAPRGG